MIVNRYSQTFLRQAVKYLPQICFFKVGSLNHQVIGIPVGLDPAPLFSNLVLFHHESDWIGKIKYIDHGLGMYTDL